MTGRLRCHLRNELKKLGDVIEILTPDEEGGYGAVLGFRHKGIAYDKLQQYLIEKHKIITRMVPEDGINCNRISTHIYNNLKRWTRSLRQSNRRRNKFTIMKLKERPMRRLLSVIFLVTIMASTSCTFAVAQKKASTKKEITTPLQHQTGMKEILAQYVGKVTNLGTLKKVEGDYFVS